MDEAADFSFWLVYPASTLLLLPVYRTFVRTLKKGRFTLEKVEYIYLFVSALLVSFIPYGVLQTFLKLRRPVIDLLTTQYGIDLVEKLLVASSFLFLYMVIVYVWYAWAFRKFIRKRCEYLLRNVLWRKKGSLTSRWMCHFDQLALWQFRWVYIFYDTLLGPKKLPQVLDFVYAQQRTYCAIHKDVWTAILVQFFRGVVYLFSYGIWFLSPSVNICHIIACGILAYLLIRRSILRLHERIWWYALFFSVPLETPLEGDLFEERVDLFMSEIDGLKIETALQIVFREDPFLRNL